MLNKEMFNIHNVHFYEPQPKAVMCIAVQKSGDQLALSRSDHTIEVWDIAHTPHVDRIFINENSVESIVWCRDRLFAADLSGTISEYNLVDLDVKCTVTVTSGACWCIAVNKDDSVLAAGTEDGYVNLFNICEDSLIYEKLLDKQEGRILCIAWNSEGDYIVSGSIDAIRIWNSHTGHVVHKLTPGRATVDRETFVWAVAVTNDFTIISGDSRGKLTFWNGHTGMYIDSFQSHKADILTVCLAEDDSKLYCTGIDPLIASFEKISIRVGIADGNQEQYKWVKSIQRNLHDHDVRSLAMYKEKLFSGGVDGYLAVSSYPPKILIKYSPLQQRKQVHFAKDEKLLLFCYDCWLEVWKLSTNVELPTVKLIELKSYKNRRIRCSNIAANGRWIVYSTDYKTKLFDLTTANAGHPVLERVDLPTNGKCVSVSCCFSADSKYLLLATKQRELFLFKLGKKQIQLLHTLNKQENNNTIVLKDVIHLLAVFPDCEYVVAADRSSTIAVWKNSEYYCSLPKYKSVPTAIAINPIDKNIFVSYADHKIVEFNIDRRKYTTFSRNLDSRHPKQWLNRLFPVEGILFDPRNNDVIILYDDTTICTVNKAERLSETNCKIPRLDLVKTTPEGSDQSEGSNSSSQYASPNGSFKSAFHILKNQKHLVFLDILNENDLIAVKVNAEQLIEKLPPVLKKNRFGVM